MENKRFRNLIIIHIILILILIGLIIKIKMQEDNFHCNDCQAKFINNIGFEKDNIIEVVLYENLTRMYEFYLKEDCSVRWMNEGYSGALINITI